MDTTAALTNAFRNLRKSGYIARQNFSCCSSCAGYAISEHVAGLPEKRRGKVRGAVFFHRQDAAAVRRGGPLFLSYGPLQLTDIGTVGVPEALAGQEIVSALRAEGLNVEWDGDTTKRIRVKL